jgi:hypothetical protein
MIVLCGERIRDLLNSKRVSEHYTKSAYKECFKVFLFCAVNST